ncbi:hypothetical protein B6I21_09175 [candidate division KSB1 bacterium 4572_119]|nr:MAG: hypothetical protein B6I21_09175 [candidate division KSB1 bacterium 4572_119]
MPLKNEGRTKCQNVFPLLSSVPVLSAVPSPINCPKLHAKTGKLILACNQQEVEYLKDTMRISAENRVPGARIISQEEAKKLEPNISCIKAAYFPSSGIVEATQLVYQLYTRASNNGIFFLTNTEVLDIKAKNNIFEIRTRTGSQTEIFESELVINSAGLYSDKIARLVNPDSPYDILPIRGESAKFYKSKRDNLRHSGLNIYPTPYPIYPNGKKADIPFDLFQQLFEQGKVVKTVGVHLTPTFDIINNEYQIGNLVTLGPATQRVTDREDNSEGLLPPEHYFQFVKPFFPNLEQKDISLHQAGVQAKLVQQYDWVMRPDEKYPNFIQLIGIDSPGLTACLSIAEYVEELLKSV